MSFFFFAPVPLHLTKQLLVWFKPNFSNVCITVYCQYSNFSPFLCFSACYPSAGNHIEESDMKDNKWKGKVHCRRIKVSKPHLCSATGSFHRAPLPSETPPPHTPPFLCIPSPLIPLPLAPGPLCCTAGHWPNPKPRSKGRCQLAFRELKGTDLSKRGKV